MWIKNKDDLKRFEDAINHCRRSVWIVTPSGEQFDLQEPSERIQGLSRMLNVKDYEEPEIFASCTEDEMVLFEFISNERAA